MDTNITPEELQRRITLAMVVAAKKLLEKKEFAEKLRPIILAEKLKIIQEHGFCCGETGDENRGKPITNPKYDWLMADDDFNKYLDECAKMYLRLGLKVASDCCPLLIADDETRKAKRHLLEVCQPVMLGLTGEALRLKPELLDQIVDNLLKILIR